MQRFVECCLWVVPYLSSSLLQLELEVRPVLFVEVRVDLESHGSIALATLTNVRMSKIADPSLPKNICRLPIATLAKVAP